MAMYGMNRSEIALLIAAEMGRLSEEDENTADGDQGVARVLIYLSNSIAAAIEQNNALLAEQIIAALRKD